MIYLQELFDSLAYGEFTNVALSKTPNGTVNPEQYPKLVSLINEGLLDLYTRFTIHKKELDLHQRAGYTQYYIRPEHVGNPLSGDPDIYIDDTKEDSVNADIIRFLEAYDSMGSTIQINDGAYPNDIFLPAPDIIKIAERDPLEVISIVYQAAYPKIKIDNTFDPTTYKLYFPAYITRPLKAYIAGQLFTGKTGKAVENAGHPANTFMYRYEQLCAELKDRATVPQMQSENTRFNDNGWV